MAMTFGFGRAAAATTKTDEPQASVGLVEQARLVAALDAMKRGSPPPEWPSGDAGAALKAFAAEIDRRGRADLETVVSFASEAAATGSFVGWVTHDVRQVAESTS
jgi:hypothetical protein